MGSSNKKTLSNEREFSSEGLKPHLASVSKKKENINTRFLSSPQKNNNGYANHAKLNQPHLVLP